jgi:hypothetical protein
MDDAIIMPSQQRPCECLLAWLCYTHWCWGKRCVVGDNRGRGTWVCLEHRCMR